VRSCLQLIGIDHDGFGLFSKTSVRGFSAISGVTVRIAGHRCNPIERRTKVPSASPDPIVLHIFNIKHMLHPSP
jgi:hypothetical protein